MPLLSERIGLLRLRRDPVFVVFKDSSVDDAGVCGRIGDLMRLTSSDTPETERGGGDDGASDRSGTIRVATVSETPFWGPGS